MRFFILFNLISLYFFAQENKITTSAFNGIVTCGYVNNGGFINFTGPNINYSIHNSKIMLGMLPSIRLKQDEAVVKNAFITPTLGMGLTLIYKMYAIQIPLYYNPKNLTENGRWHIGIGIGLYLNELNKKNHAKN
jgi:hypothetical protein